MTKDTPDTLTVLRSLALELPDEARIAFIAQLERGAARRYRRWAERSGSLVVSTGLRLCAAREDTIADMADATFPAPDGAAEALSDVLRRASAATGTVHEGRALSDSLAMQAAAERAGAATWRSLIEGVGDSSHRTVLETCARLEEESAEFIERMLAAGLVEERVE